MNESNVFVSEIFSSAQGEGVHVGRRQIFVRFCECHRACAYCDTPVQRTDTAAIEVIPGSGTCKYESNPLSINKLSDLMTELNQPDYAHDDMFLTGGEPLLQIAFLETFLPHVRSIIPLPVHLETSGDLPEAFARITDWIDHVLMDIKLPSVTGETATWEQHRAFMELIDERTVSATIKLVVNADTSDDDLSIASKLLKSYGKGATVVLQPMTKALHNDRVPSAQQVLQWQSSLARRLGRSVRIIPQCHKLMGLL